MNLPIHYYAPKIDKSYRIMKKYSNSFLSLTATAALLTNAQSASLIAFWSFDDGFDAGDDQVQIVHAATNGSGTLYQQRAEIDGNGKSGTAFSDSETGINSPADRSIAWDDFARSGDNDGEFFIQISTLGFTDITIRFDVEGNDEAGIESFDLRFSTSLLTDITNLPDVTGTIKDFENGESTRLLNNELFTAGANDGFVEQEINLSILNTEVENQETLALRFDDFEGNDDIRFDNILITGTVVPEPSASLLLLLAYPALLRRKRTA